MTAINTVETVADALKVMNECERRGELLVRELFGWKRYKDASGRWILAPSKQEAMKVRSPAPETVLVDERCAQLYKQCEPEWWKAHNDKT